MHVIIGFGGNLGAVEMAFRQAVTSLDQSPDVRVRRRSSLYRSKPVGPEQPDYLNAAILVEACTDLRNLLRCCLEIERRAGRNRSADLRWGPRTIDLDLLAADGVICRGRVLELPHPRLVERAFALVPAAEVAPRWVHPLVGRTLGDLADDVVRADSRAAVVVGPW